MNDKEVIKMLRTIEETVYLGNLKFYEAIDAAIKALEQHEVIRCKDCKWCKDADGSMCKNPASWVVATDRDFGCVLAERKNR